ncbi:MULTISPECIES: sulfurtransferase [unclassified Exiguobacterium]|uniref:sulfurtransferase n=1 Tax=unclassified Exiguobacterium TaxID=2644629 RepID=UPI0025C396C9|nr:MULTISPECIES: sulfurtransferase [unclassified Exiguobacterium]
MFPTIQMADLQQLVRTDQIRWFDCRYDLQQPEYGRNAFLEQHVEGAQHLDLTTDLSGPIDEVGGRHPLPSKEAWQHTLEQHGVTPEDFVVLYDDGFPYAARAWWLFKWIGHERVVVLEGGFSSYLAFDLPVTDETFTYEPSQYTPRFQDEMVVSFEELKDQLTETLVIDSRAPDRYRGEIEPLDHVAGHIPGAVNCYFEQALSPDGRLRDAEDLKELYADILPVTAPILYCGSGVTACVNVIALHSLGKTDVRLYAGSYSDWVSRGEDVSRS